MTDAAEEKVPPHPLGVTKEELVALILDCKARRMLPHLIGSAVMDRIGKTAGDRQYEIGVQEQANDLIREVIGLQPLKVPNRVFTQRVKPREQPAPARLNRVRLSRVPIERVEWLWRDRIAVGKLSLLVGDPGMGKSMMTADLIARITTGAAWPDGEPAAARGSALLLTTEDDAGDTIKPRLIAARGDPSQVSVVTSVQAGNARRGFDLTLDLPALEKALDDMEATDMEPVRLIVVDPLSAYLGGKLDSHRNTDVRAALEPLAEMAARKRVAVLGISHLTKSSGDRTAVGRVLGSIAFAAVARVVLFAVRDDEQEEGKPERRLLLPAKNNLGDDRRGLAYSIENVTFEDGGETYEAPRVVWSEASEKRVEDVLREPAVALLGGRPAPRGWLACCGTALSIPPPSSRWRGPRASVPPC